MEAADTAAGDPPDPDRLRRAVHGSAAAEVATATDGRPQTFPLCPFYDPDRETVVVTSPPAFAGKVDAVSEHPQLSLLFYQADEPFVLRGRGTVRDDDLEANAAYVGELVQTEPDSPKTEGFSETAATLESRLGRFLLGWYALRIVVEIEPVAVEPVEPTVGSLPSWPARGVDADEAAGYDRLAFTVVDGAGWPMTRSVADVEVDGDRARLDVPTTVAAGQPACLLCHWHTPGLDELGQRLFRGRCRPAGDDVAFEPASSFRLRNESLLDRLRFIVDGKRRTRRYFQRRSG
jgi:hypothetical protein